MKGDLRMIRDKVLVKLSLRMEYGLEISRMDTRMVMVFGRLQMGKGSEVFGKTGATSRLLEFLVLR
jgi:hypothetical protein